MSETLALEGKKARKPDKRTVEQAPFDGFPLEIANGAYCQLPVTWINLVGCIQNLSELKVVLYVLRHSWGFQEYDVTKHITTDEFVNGRKRRDGTRMDIGTGLSERAVINGLALAEKHGFLVCEVDDSDLGRVKKSYKLKMQAAQEQSEDEPAQEEAEMQAVQPGVHNLHPRGAQSADRSKNRTREQTFEQTQEIRIVHPSEILEEVVRHLPPLEDLRGTKKAPLFLRNMIDDFSRDLGDHDHIASNISQANRIYQASGMDPEAFQQVLYEVRATAKRATSIRHKNSHGRPNRMPYFFRCLAGALKHEMVV